MDNISYFKLQAKNLFRDFKVDLMSDDEAYSFSPQFFDVNKIVSEYDVDCEDFCLMKAQHIIAKMVGFKSWAELMNSSDAVLEQRKDILENLGVKVEKKKVYHIDFSGYEKLDEGKAGDYLVKCPRLPELEEIITLKADCYFMSTRDNDLEKYQADKNHIYVNVVPKNSTIRVLVPEAKYPDWYAVSVKNMPFAK